MKNHNNRLGQWVDTIITFRGISRDVVAKELGMRTDALARRLNGVLTELPPKEAEVFARWGNPYGAKHPWDIITMYNQKAAGPAQFFDLFGDPRLTQRDEAV